MSGNDWPDNALRFGLLSLSRRGAGQAGFADRWRPRIVHCNDWQTGLAPAYLHFMPGEKARTVMTIHNLAYQGVFPPQTASRLGLPPSAFQPGRRRVLRQHVVSQGRLVSTPITLTTVSPTYAQEIQSAPLGMGMEGLLVASCGRV